MDYIPKDKILETKPDTLEFIRKQYDLDKPGRMKEAVNILHEWVQKQNHFKKKDFNKYYYEMTIIACKGSLERAKKSIDKMCTMRTLLPQFFINYNVKTEFDSKVASIALLPKLTDDHYRIKVLKIHNVIMKSVDFTNFYMYNLNVLEYLKVHDYMNGLVIILDYSDANITEILSKINLLEFRQMASIYLEGYALRIRGIHVISSSALINGVITLLKQVLSAKLVGRVHSHKSIEEVYEYIPKSILPKDYGGEELSLKELRNQWMEVLSSEEHLKHMQDMREAVTDETRRQQDQFNEQYAGIPGTFRVLSVD